MGGSVQYMDGPLVYVDQAEIRPGKAAELREAIGELAAFVEAQEPQLLSYAAFIDPDERNLSVIHVHRDAASLERHALVAGPMFPRFVDLVRVVRIDLYGSPSEPSVTALRGKAELLGGAVVQVHPLEAGFLR
jgi:quinol monooxygenase YgiN